MSLRLATALVAALWIQPACIVASPPAASAPAAGSPAHARHDRSEPAPPRADRPADRPTRPRPAPVRPAPEPEPPRTRPRPPARACDRDAPILYAETTRALPGREVKRRFVVRESGAWSIAESGERTTGCLEREELDELEAALARASFEPPPPPDMTCMAMPTERKLYEDEARGRRAAAERPCGKQPLNPDVSALSRLAGALAEPPADDAPGAEPPRSCHTRAPHLVSASTHPLRANSDRPSARVRIAADGAWSRREGGAVTCGKLSRRELHRLRAKLRRADIDTIDRPIACRAVPTTEHRLATRRDRAVWQAPCGSSSPTRETRELAEHILSLGT